MNILRKIRKFLARIRGKTYIAEGKCNQCGACCKMITLVIDSHPISSEEEFEHLKIIYPKYERFQIVNYDENAHLRFSCKYLGKNNKCQDYKNRPQICRDYPNQDLMMRGGKLVSTCGYKFIPTREFQAVLEDIIEKSESKIKPEIKNENNQGEQYE